MKKLQFPTLFLLLILCNAPNTLKLHFANIFTYKRCQHIFLNTISTVLFELEFPNRLLCLLALICIIRISYNICKVSLPSYRQKSEIDPCRFIRFFMYAVKFFCKHTKTIRTTYRRNKADHVLQHLRLRTFLCTYAEDGDINIVIMQMIDD